MAPPKEISRRKGTTNHGSIYEQRIAALLGVRCVLQEDVEDMWIATNVEGLGAFDDVVLFVQTRKGNCSSKDMYLIQIKYKKNKKLNLTAGDNDLKKYEKTFLKIKKDFSKEKSPLESCSTFEDIKFLLFTNTQIDTSNIHTQDCSSDDFLNTGKIFQILQDTNTAYDADFLKQTYFYYNQIDVSKVTNIIKKEIDKHFTNCNVVAITKFFENWHSEEFENKVTLGKEDIQSLILEIVLSNYIPEPTTDEFTKADIWNEVANQFKFIFIKHEDYLAKIWQGVKRQLCNFFDDQHIDLLNWDNPLIQASNKIKRIKQCPLKVQPTIRKDKSSYNFKDIYLLLWQISKLPLILNLNTKSQKDIDAALSKLDPSQSSGKRYIFIGEPTSNLQQHSRQFNFFDIDRDTREIFLKNAYMSLQGKEALTLKELKLGDEALEKITPDLLIHLLQPITKKVDPDPGYLPRFVRQSTVHVDVLTIPNAVFVIAVNDSENYWTLEKFGTIMAWSLYKLLANKLVIKYVNILGIVNTKCINIIILNFDSLKHYKYIEKLIREVRECEEQTVHYLQYQNGNRLTWLHSNGDANQVKPFLLSNSTTDLSDSELFPCLTFNILSGNAGEGKSSLLQFVANNSPTNVWIIELIMREISEYTEKGEFSDIMSFLFHQSNTETDRFKNFSQALFQSLYNDSNILLIIDGIDEVEYNSNIEHFLFAVKSLGIKVVIATRPSLNDTLDETFNIPLLSLKPLTDEDCQLLIKLTLQRNYEEISELNINIMLQKVYSWSNIIGVPLLLKLFVTLLNNRILQDFTDFDLCDLFNSFINEQLRKVNSCSPFTIRTLSKSALFVLYKEEAVSQIFNIEEYFEAVDDKIVVFVNSKIIEKLDKNKIPIFAHKSLAEFLVAKYLFRLAENSTVPQNFLESLFYKELETVRLFFDMMALKGSAFQDVFIGINLSDFSNVISNDFVDNFGRNILHIAASYGNKCELRIEQSLWSGVRIYESYNDVQDNIFTPCREFMRRTVVPMNFVSKLLQRNFDPHKKDNLFKMDVFEFATASGSLEVIEALLSSKCVEEVRYINKDVILFHVVRNGYINIFRALGNKNFDLKISPAMNNLLHIALYSERLEMIQELCNGKISIDEPDQLGYSPLINWLTLSKLTSKKLHSVSINICTISPLNDNQLAILNYFIDKNISLNAVNVLGESLLHALCDFQKAAVIEKLIENGADVNRKTILGDTPLHYASRYSLKNVKLLAEKYKSAIDIPNNIGHTPLYDAIRNNKIDIMEYLIEKGACVNINKDELSPLDVAITKGYVDCVKLLLEKHAEIIQTDTMAIAIISGNLDCVKLLLEHGTILNEELCYLAVLFNRNHVTEFFLSQKLNNIANVNINELLFHSIHINDTGLIDILISYGADVNAKNRCDESSPLHLACTLGFTKTIKHLIKKKSILNAKNILGETPLITAARLEHLEVLEILINQGSDLEKYGSDALRAAIESNNSNTFDYLISVGIDINRISSNGYAPIHAASKVSIYWVKKLKHMGADVNLKSGNEGSTPLIMAVFKGYHDVAEYLVENGSHINEETSNQHTALTVASQEGHLECVKFLIDKGSNLSKYGPLGISVAATIGHITVIDYLISAGADIHGIVDNNWAPIHIAAFESNVKTIEYLLSKGANVNVKTVLGGFTPLMIASSTGRQNIVEYLVENGGAKINEECSPNQTALTIASQEGHLECVKLLIDKGSDLCKYGPAAIYFAACNRHIAIIDCLISVGADINGIIDNDRAPVHVAALRNNVETIEYLLSNGASVNNKTVLEGFTPLMFASLKGRQDIVEYLIENGAKVNEEISLDRHTALTMASQEGHLECVKFLIDKGSDVQKCGPRAISAAAINGHITVIDYLISVGVDINGPVDKDKFPIHDAVLEGNVKSIEYLLSKGANIHSKTVLSGCTPLMLASLKGHQDILEYLIENGAEINEERRSNNHTALSMASQEGQLECVKFLIDKGSNVGKYGSRAISAAVIKGHITVIDYLISAGADIHGIVDNNWAPIHIAALESNVKTIEYLLSKGANVNVKTVLGGFTPLMIASSTGRQNILEYLVENGGAKINEECSPNQTALTIVSQEGHLECVKLLIDKGSDLCKYGPAAIYFAACNHHITLIDCLISAGADINGIIDNDRAPVHVAALRNNVETIEYLLSNGASVNNKTVIEGFTPLMFASLKGHQDIVEYLIENGAKVNEESSLDRHTALTMASQEGHLECVKFLIDKGSDVQKCGPRAISAAAINGHIAVIDYLISVGVDINGTVDKDKFPIHDAVLEGNVKSIEYLLSKGANIHSKTVLGGCTPLMFASLKGHQDILEYLIENGAEINEERRSNNHTALSMASQEGQLECVKFLIDKGSNVGKYGSRAISAAVIKGHITVIDYLISAGADIHGIVDNNWAPIHIAALESNVKTIEYLLSKGANVNVKTVLGGFTPLMIASSTGRQNIVEYLVENGGAKINEECSSNQTALTIASQEGHLECVKLLIDKGSDLRKFGPAAIYFAACNHHITIIDYLILAGADINDTVMNRMSPTHCAILTRNLRAIECLLNKGADINIKTAVASNTPLILAAMNGSKDFVEYLIKRGANINDANVEGHTALISACTQGHLDCVEVLIGKGSDLSKYGLVARNIAAEKGHSAIVDFLDSRLPT